jgi:phage terminase small subunit
VDKVKPEDKELTESQKAFCMEWIFDFNGSRAYQTAYPESSPESARAAAARLLADVNIRAYAKSLQDNLAETTGISRVRVIREHEKLAFSSIAHLHNTWITRKEFEELTEDQKACISEISTQTRMEKNPIEDGPPIQIDFIKIKLYDKQKSLDAINKMLGFDAPSKIDLSTLGEKLNNDISKVEIVKVTQNDNTRGT